MSARTNTDPTPEDYRIADEIVRAIIRKTRGEEEAVAFSGTEQYGPNSFRTQRRLKEYAKPDVQFNVAERRHPELSPNDDTEPDLEDCE